ncbi:MAG: ADP-glyceromanno-heptose 6-epimerase [Pseudomonadota bacterium]|nr:ADP-glyceromanno-heptose 6-epimerase [Pseudomonadota bacterium]
MIIVTGGAGFIGSNLINKLIIKQNHVIVSVDHNNEKNKKYFLNQNFIKIQPKNLEKYLIKNKKKIITVVHLGAITSTTEKNVNLIIKNNLELSIFLWNWCLKNNKRLIYASSAATYGNGYNGFDDSEDDKYLSKQIPLNLYGWSKHIFDRHIFKKKKQPQQIVGLKFFNVYGPNEIHKGKMRSIALKIHQTITKGMDVNLFKSHNKDYKNGEQLRDFIYVKDVVSIIEWFLENKKINGLFNVGTGIPRTFNDVAKAVFLNSNKKEKIKYIDTPIQIRRQYQYFTKANVQKLRKSGYVKKFFSLEDGIKDYIVKYLIK